jgi:hypothetical protein
LLFLANVISCLYRLEHDIYKLEDEDSRKKATSTKGFAERMEDLEKLIELYTKDLYCNAYTCYENAANTTGTCPAVLAEKISRKFTVIFYQTTQQRHNNKLRTDSVRMIVGFIWDFVTAL